MSDGRRRGEMEGRGMQRKKEKKKKGGKRKEKREGKERVSK